MSPKRRYQLEALGVTVAICLGVVWLVGDRVVHKVKGLRR